MLKQYSKEISRKCIIFSVLVPCTDIFSRNNHFNCISRRNFSNSNVCRKRDVGKEDKLPVFDYGKINLSSKRLYVFGSALPIGLPQLIRPSKEGQRRKLYMLRPVRNEFGYNNPVIDIAAGHGFSLLATQIQKNSSFYLFGCGVNNFSQIGHQSVRPKHPLEIVLSFAPISLPVTKKPKILCLGAGRAHSLVSVEGDGLFSLGDNSNGQCGRFIIKDEQYFGSKLIHKMKLPTEENIVSIASRFDLSLVINESGEVFTFGSNKKGALGRGRLLVNNWTPGKVGGDLQGERVVSAATSGASVLCVTDKGEIFGWGCNEWGQIDSSNPACVYYEPRHIKLGTNIGKIKEVAMGDIFSFVLNEAGNVYTWGQGHALGLGPENHVVRSPTLIPPPLFGKNEFSSDVQVTNISSSYTYAAAVNSQGDLYTWGENKSGCLGLRRVAVQPFPLKVCLGGSVHKVALGDDHTIVLSKGAI